MASITINPANDTAVSRDGVNEVFGTIRAGAGNVTENGSTQTAPGQVAATTTSNQYGTISRGGFNFTPVSSGVPAGATISAATFSLYCVSKTDGYTSSLGSIGLVQFTPATPATPVNSDYANFGTTRWATDLTIAGLATSSYNAFTLNATGLAALQTAVTGSTNFIIGTRLAYDIDNSAPTWVSGANARQVTGMVANADSAKRPKMDITYTTTSIKTVNGLAVGSVKTYNGLAIASVKTINGLA